MQKILSYPYDLIGYAFDGVFYNVLGLKDGALKLKVYGEEDIIPGGTPFIVIPNEIGTSGDEVSYVCAYLPEQMTESTEMTYTFEPQKQNGMIATIVSNDSIAGGGIIFENKVIKAVEADRSEANCSYFYELPTENTEEGDESLEFAEDLITGIENGIVSSVKNNSAVYSVTGIKVQNNANIKKLPKGIYIVGNKKIFVK